VLNRVFQKTFQAAKHVRTHTAITEGQVSVANVAVDLAVNIFGELGSLRILLLGPVRSAKDGPGLSKPRAAGLVVASRTFERAAELAATLGGTALPFEQREERLEDFDIVVCSTAAPHTVISAAAVAATMKYRPAQPLFFIDLALPRDVDTAVTSLDNVYLYNLDDLAQIAEENRRAREAEWCGPRRSWPKNPWRSGALLRIASGWRQAKKRELVEQCAVQWTRDALPAHTSDDASTLQSSQLGALQFCVTIVTQNCKRTEEAGGVGRRGYRTYCLRALFLTWPRTDRPAGLSLEADRVF